MARLMAHEMQLAIENIILRRLRSMRVSRPKFVSEELAMEIMRDAIPTEAYDAKPAWEHGILFFNNEINDETVRYAQEELIGTHYNIKPGVPITLYLSSFGGDIFAGLALVSTISEIRRSGRQVNAHIMGAAFSMASLLCQACDIRTIEPTAYFMIHEVAWGSEYQKTSMHRDEVETTERMENTIFSLYSARSGKPVSYYKQKMTRRDWYLTAREAVTEGLVDRIKPTPNFRKKTPKAIKPE